MDAKIARGIREGDEAHTREQLQYLLGDLYNGLEVEAFIGTLSENEFTRVGSLLLRTHEAAIQGIPEEEQDEAIQKWWTKVQNKEIFK